MRNLQHSKYLFTWKLKGGVFYSTCQNVNGIITIVKEIQRESFSSFCHPALVASLHFLQCCRLDVAGEQQIRSLKLIRWLPTRRMNGAASLERWNCSGWKLNTATNCCYGWKEKLPRERLNLEEELAVEAYPTFVIDERGRPTCTSLNFVNSCDRSTVWRNFLEY